MPVVEVDPDELRRLVGRERTDEELRADLFALGLEYEGETDDGEFQLEFGPDRLDRLSVEGVARSLRYQYGDDRGVYVPGTNDADWTIEVEESVPAERPHISGAVVRGVALDGGTLESLIQLQEKLHATMGRDRAKGAIGVHDLTMLKGEDLGEGGGPTVTYRGIAADADRFVPLESDAERTPEAVLTEHPTGRTYADLVADYERMPAIYDELGLFSFPPVINGRRTEVSTESRDLLIELTGTDQWTLDRMCNVVCYALDARGATVEDVEVRYPEGWHGVGGTHVRPDLSTDRKTVTHDRIETMLGVDLSPEAVVDHFERAGLDADVVGADRGDATAPTRDAGTNTDAEAAADAGTNTNAGTDGEAGTDTADGPTYEVEIPPYRVDVLHPLDLVDDVGRAYGFNDLEPRYPDVATVGGRHGRSRLEDAARTSLVGLGFEDLLNFHMISEAENYDRMGVAPGSDALGGGEPVTITEPYSEDYTMVRTWALPSLLMVLENNTHRTYPQDLAEIGLTARRDGAANTGLAEARHVAAVLARTDATYEDAKARLAALCRDFGADLATPPTDHPSFIDGRAAAVEVDGEPAGVVGEVHPRVLVEHDLELPVAAFELRLDALE